MKLSLTMDLDNAAFDTGYTGGRSAAYGGEVARILRRLADEIEPADLIAGDEHTLRDKDGNRVGLAVAVPDRCPKCQDVPGKDGLGRPCKGCGGSGWLK